MPTLRELTEYYQPTTLDEALKLLRRTRVKTVPLAGGTSLVPEAAQDIQAVVDLSGLGLSYIKTSEASGSPQGLAIGATTRLQTIVEHADARSYAEGVLVAAILDSAARNTREAASLAGSIVSAPGNSPLFTVLLALDARLALRRARSTQAEEVALSYWSPQLRSLILRVDLPAQPRQARFAYEKIARTPADQPIVCVAARAIGREEQLTDVRIALGGVDEKPIVIAKAAGSIEELVQLAMSPIHSRSDYFATAEYRREMIGVLVRRVLSRLSIE